MGVNRRVLLQARLVFLHICLRSDAFSGRQSFLHNMLDHCSISHKGTFWYPLYGIRSLIDLHALV